jgi:hypothetical protein
MLYFYILIGLSVTILAFFRRDLLTKKESFTVILAISIMLSAIGLLLHFTEAGRIAPSGALLAPLMSLGLYRILRKIFLLRFHREPRDTYLDWTPGLAGDRVFNILYFAGSAWLLLSAMIGMRVLSKAGW